MKVKWTRRREEGATIKMWTVPECVIFLNVKNYVLIERAETDLLTHEYVGESRK